MHPLDVLESRAHNAAGLLSSKGPHTLTQLRCGIAVAREALPRMAAARGPGAERIGAQVQRICRLASSRAGRALRKEHGIDLLDAIPVEALRRQGNGQDEVQLARVEAARAANKKGP